MQEFEYDYKSIIAEAASLLVRFEDQVLRHFVTHIVEPEYNVAYLVLDVGAFAIQGGIGGEVLKIVSVGTVPPEDAEGNWAVKTFAPFSIFLNRKIVQARSIGAAWNGHGFEFSFEVLLDRTMIIQSIYAGQTPPGFDDCLRFGIGHYTFDDSDV